MSFLKRLPKKKPVEKVPVIDKTTGDVVGTACTQYVDGKLHIMVTTVSAPTPQVITAQVYLNPEESDK